MGATRRDVWDAEQDSAMSGSAFEWWQLALSTSSHWITALAWPAVVVAALALFRKELRALLVSVRSFRLGTAEASWGQTADEVSAEVTAGTHIEASQPLQTRLLMSERFAGEARSNPAAAILKSYGALEEALRKRLEAAGWQRDLFGAVLSVPQLALEAANRGLVPQSTARAIEGLRTLRELAVHDAKDGVDREKAEDFLRLVDSVLFVINAP